MKNEIDKLIKKIGAHHLKQTLPFLDRLKLELAAFCLSLLNGVLAALKKILYRTNHDPKRILVFRTGSLGDSICATPSLNLIRKYYPKAHITLLSNTGRKSLVSPEKVINKNLYNDLIDYLGMSFFELLKLLRQRNFDLVIELPQTDAVFLRQLRDLIVFRLVAPAGWGWHVSRILVFKKTIEKYIYYPNEAMRLIQICGSNGLKSAAIDFSLNFETHDQLIADNFFAENNLSEKPAIAIAVGANSVKNRWPINYFAEVINYFRLTNSIILVGGPEDNDLVESFRGLENVYNCCGKFTPMQSALIIKKCALSITNDTGPLHLSYAVGTPLIGIFASRDFYGKWFPPENTKHRVFRTPDVACSLCFIASCDNNICMQAILPRDVINAAEDIMT